MELALEFATVAQFEMVERLLRKRHEFESRRWLMREPTKLRDVATSGPTGVIRIKVNDRRRLENTLSTK